MNTRTITITVEINAPVSKVWELYTQVKHIKNWNYASEDWHTPRAENDLRVNGKFSSRMEAKDGSFGFDFGGTYTQIDENKLIAYTLGDDRKVQITFTEGQFGTIVTIIFEAEQTNSLDLQKSGWLAILNNFKKYVESNY